MLNVEASTVDGIADGTVVTVTADNAIRSFASGCGVPTSAYDSDATGGLSDCDSDRKLVPWRIEHHTLILMWSRRSAVN